MKRKELLCAVLALTLLFSVQPAAALTGNQRETVIEGIARLPVIEVVVPAYVDIMINPLEMPVWIGGEETDAQIICDPAYIVSFSEVPLKVDVTVTGAVFPDSDMTLTNQPTQGAGNQKSVFAYFEMQRSSSEYPEDVTWDARYSATKHLVVKNGGSTSKKEIVTLPPLTLEGELPENAFAWFRLTGDAVKAPTNAWNENDGISVSVAFTFTPLPYGST